MSNNNAQQAQAQVSPEALAALQRLLTTANVTPEASAPAVVEQPKEEGFDAREFALQNGFSGLRPGRFYVSDEVVTAIARVRKTGKPEVVTTNGGKNAVVVWLHGDTVAVQNTYTKS